MEKQSFIPQRLLGEALLNSAAMNPDKTLAIYKDSEYSYKYLKECSEKMAQYLLYAGIVKGDRVAIFMNNSWQTIVAIYGATLAGAVFLVINPQTKDEKLQYILNDSGARILLTDISVTKMSGTLNEVEALEEVIVALKENNIHDSTKFRINTYDQIFSSRQSLVPYPVIIPNDLAALIYTSGSTGFPKGVMMTHQSMVFTSWSLIQYLRLTKEERIMLVLPLAFDYGLYQLFMAVTAGGTLIIEHSFVFPTTVYKQIEKWKPTVFPGVPTIFAMMIESNKKTGIAFSGIQKITNTAAALTPEMIPDLKKVFPDALIFKMYGLTECKRVCYLEPELIDEKTASVGKAIPGTEVFLLDTDGNEVSGNGPGILHVRGPHVMAGYWKNEKLTEDMLRPGRIPGERILCTHDLFRMDEEGFLYFLGRTDDIIKTRGEKVSPLEIENVICKTEGVREAAVIGYPHEIMGEGIAAYVTTYNNTKPDIKTIQNECAKKLEIFMIPQQVIFIDEMPKSPNGKIDKKELKQRLLSS
jgi:long-chain acyl-CoA synthetase